MHPSHNDGHRQTTPALMPSSADTTPEEAEAELHALCAAYEAQALLEASECRSGCDHSDAALSPTGCRW